MTTMPLDWHREGFKNASRHLEELRRNVERQLAELEKKSAELKFYAEQIAAAEKRGLKAFDSDRLLVSKTKKEST